MRWVAPLACGSEASFIERIEGLAGKDVASLPSDMRFVARARHEDNAWTIRLDIEHEGQRSSRTVSSPDCSTARDAIALMIALHLKDDAELNQQENSTAPAPELEPPPSPSRDETREHVATPSAPRFLFGTYVGGNVGTLPHAAFGLQALAGLSLTHAWSIELRGISWLSQTSALAEPSGAEARFTHRALRLLVCLAPVDSRPFDAVACLGPSLSFLRGTSDGVLQPGTTRAVYGGWVTEGAGRLRLSSAWALRLAFGVEIATPPPSFIIDGIGPVHEVSTLAAFATFGPEIRF